jgi:hypothetical protein
MVTSVAVTSVAVTSYKCRDKHKIIYEFIKLLNYLNLRSSI